METKNPKTLGLVFILVAFALGGIHLFFETKNDVPEIWISALLVVGLLLRLAPKKLVELIGRVWPAKQNKTKSK